MPIRVPVDEYTSPNPVAATENLSIDEIGQLMQAHGVRHLPIVRRRRPLRAP
jgi:acetoin utilization protein AcuB